MRVQCSNVAGFYETVVEAVVPPNLVTFPQPVTCRSMRIVLLAVTQVSASTTPVAVNG